MRGFTAFGLVGFVALGACGPQESELGDAQSIPVLTWQQFREMSTKTFEGDEIYVVEGDLAVSLDELWVEYNRLLDGTRAYNRSLLGDFGTATRPSTVNRVGSADDLWTTAQAANLTYCVTNDFGSNKARMVSEMAQATADLEAAGNFNFVYTPAQDGNCNNGNGNVVFSVRPWTSGGACAFFPSGGGCVVRTIVIDIVDLDTNPAYGNVTTLGVLRHELGHTLGLRHEHIRAPGTFCTESSNWRAVTAYDSNSMMHYPWCPGATNNGDLVVTGPDATGMGLLYPGAAASFAAANVTIDEVVRTVSLSGFSTPSIVLGPPSFGGGDPSTTRLQNVSNTSFQHFLDEWDYRDGPHLNETIGYLAVDGGISTLGTLAARSGRVTLNHNWATVSLGAALPAAPVVVAQVGSFNGGQACTTRIRNVTTTSFQIRLQEEEANDGTHVNETVHWIAVVPGNTTVNGRSVRVGRTGNSVTDAWSTIGYGASLTSPVVIAEMQTFDGSDPAALRHRNLGATSVQVKVEEEASNDTEVAHTTEVVGWIAIGN